MIDNNEYEDNIEELNNEPQMGDEAAEGHSNYVPPQDSSPTHKVAGMYQNWFLDYASYVILERAVPHLYDGLKPVQRRILHAMRELDDGRYNKVANVVGYTMQYHPHGDASIGGALVQLGQKDYLIDCQGNWGNILTGDSAAAPRYIEARLSRFAHDVVFNPKTTEWKLSYDGRNKEPITLPVKFPLLLVHGVEGIAVGLSSRILPHNFCEVCDAAVSYLNGEEFTLYPDFQTGGSIDVSRYHDGDRTGRVRIRAKISKLEDNKTLAITEIPYGKTTPMIIESILKAVENGKMKVRRVDDNTSDKVEILVHLAPGVSSDKTIDALYAFTDCEISITPCCCVIDNRTPVFITVSEILRRSVDNTKELLRRELEIRKGELLEQLHFASLESIFIEERIYKDREFEQAKDMDTVLAHIDMRLEPYKPNFIREITRDDLLRLMEIKMARILRFNKEKAEELIARLKDEVAAIDKELSNMVAVTKRWFTKLKEKYGERYPRLTEIRNLDTIVAAKVVEANQKLYINRAEGFIGTSLKKDEFVNNCSDIDDVILFYKDGKYKIVKVCEKLFVGKNIIHIDVFKKNDKRTIYNVVYRDGAKGIYYIKRFAATGMTRDKEYDLTQGSPGSKVVYFSSNPNGEAEVIKVMLRPNPRLRNTVIERDFSDIAIKGRQSMGNILTKNEVHRVTLKRHGSSTLGGRQVWFDRDILRINFDSHGEYLGEFHNDDKILVLLDNGDFYLSPIDLNNHYEDNILRIEKYDPSKVWTAILYDASQQNYPYLKRFTLDANARKQNCLGDNKENRLVWLSETPYPRIQVMFGGDDSFREPLVIETDEFIAVKSYKARGKRLTTYTIDEIIELEPTRVPVEPELQPMDDADEGNTSEIDTTQQATLFDEDEQ